MKKELTREEAIEWIKKIQPCIDKEIHSDGFCLNCGKEIENDVSDWETFHKLKGTPKEQVNPKLIKAGCWEKKHSTLVQSDPYEPYETMGVVTFLKFIFDIKEEELK